MFDAYAELFGNENFILVFKFLYYTSFVWLPAGCLFILWELWVRSVQMQHFASKTYILLEIKLPKDVFKSPQAAEFFINGLYQTVGEKNWYEKYWKGQVRSWFSLEMASINGAVHFFIWTKSDHKALIEANLYSQYPGIEVYEVQDYTLPVSYNSEINTYWAAEFELTAPDVFPIKTYIDYGLDKDPKEELKIDPLTPLIEFLGALPKEHEIWIQILVRSHKAEEWDAKAGKMVDARWEKAAQKEIDKIIDSTKGEKDKEGKLIPGTGRRLTDSENETIKALGRSVSKKGFDVGIRAIYFAPKDLFQITNVGGIIGGITHFNSSMNGFKPTRSSEERYTNFFFAWMKRRSKKRDKEKSELLDKFKRRAYFYRPFKSPHFVLNSEELATMYHFPGGVSSTPTFARIESRKGEAPANIPL